MHVLISGMKGSRDRKQSEKKAMNDLKKRNEVGLQEIDINRRRSINIIKRRKKADEEDKDQEIDEIGNDNQEIDGNNLSRISLISSSSSTSLLNSSYPTTYNKRGQGEIQNMKKVNLKSVKNELKNCVKNHNKNDFKNLSGEKTENWDSKSYRKSNVENRSDDNLNGTDVATVRSNSSTRQNDINEDIRYL